MMEHAHGHEREARGCPDPVEEHQRHLLGSTPESRLLRYVNSGSSLLVSTVGFAFDGDHGFRLEAVAAESRGGRIRHARNPRSVG